ncbi:hypothetical protein D9601_00330 [Sphingomonas sp. MA1305]|nr:hypothetical protein [Sphingomonas sp. MA1305]
MTDDQLEIVRWALIVKESFIIAISLYLCAKVDNAYKDGFSQNYGRGLIGVAMLSCIVIVFCLGIL